MSDDASTQPALRRRQTALRPLLSIGFVLALAACGGGGGGGAPQAISGVVVDGYIAGATVSCLRNGATIASTLSNARGEYAFELASQQRCDTVQSVGGIDIGLTPDDPTDDRPAPAGAFRTPVPVGNAAVSHLVISPLTTLVHALVAQGAAPAEAQQQVRVSLGLTPGVDLLTTDPVDDVALYRANAVVAQFVEQVTRALAAAAEIHDDDGTAALAQAAMGALAAGLSTLHGIESLAPPPAGLDTRSPLFAIVEQAASNAAAGATTGTALGNLNTTTFAAIAAPLVASATSSVNDADSVAAVVASVQVIDDRDRAATVLDSMREVVAQPHAGGDGQLNQTLQTVYSALNQADEEGVEQAITLTVGTATATAPVPVGLSNYVRLADDAIHLGDASSPPVALADFERTEGVSLARQLATVGFVLQRSARNTQLAKNGTLEVPLAMQVTDDTRTFQAIIDRVRLAADDTGKVSALIPDGARLRVYGQTRTAETLSPLEIELAGRGLDIVSTTDGTIWFSFDRLFDTIGSKTHSDDILGRLAAERVSDGRYNVTMVIGTLRVARSAAVDDATPVLARAQTVTLRTGGASVSGYGFRGFVRVTL